MKKKSPSFQIVLAALMLLAALLACVRASPTAAPPQPPSNPVLTAAAGTIAAQLTEFAESATPLPVEPVNTTPSAPGEATVSTGTGSAPDSPTPTLTATQTASSTPEMTLTSTPTNTPEQTPTSEVPATLAPPVSDPAETLGSPDWRDTFGSGANWPLYSDDNIDFEIDSDRLSMTAHNPNGWDSWMIAVPSLDDFYLEMSAAPEECSGRDRYGLFFRAPEPNEGYLLGFNCAGQFSLRKWDGSSFTNLLGWVSDAHINTGEGQANRLGVMAKGDSLVLFANGYQLVEVIDDSYTFGRFGVFISSANTDDFKVLVSDVAYWVLP